MGAQRIEEGGSWINGGDIPSLLYYQPLPFLFFFFFNLFLVVLGLRCCAGDFSSCSERGLLLVAVHRLLIAVASLVAEHGL